MNIVSAERVNEYTKLEPEVLMLSFKHIFKKSSLAVHYVLYQFFLALLKSLCALFTQPDYLINIILISKAPYTSYEIK